MSRIFSIIPTQRPTRSDFIPVRNHVDECTSPPMFAAASIEQHLHTKSIVVAVVNYDNGLHAWSDIARWQGPEKGLRTMAAVMRTDAVTLNPSR